MAEPGRPYKSDPRIEKIIFKIEKCENEIVKTQLSEIGIDKCDGFKRTPLVWAAFYNNTELLKWLISNGANVNHKDKNGYSALHFAGQERNFESAKMLIENVADIELSDNHGNTPIWTSILNSKGDYSLVKLLVSKGANLDMENNHNMTPRQLAELIVGFDLNTLNK